MTWGFKHVELVKEASPNEITYLYFYSVLFGHVYYYHFLYVTGTGSVSSLQAIVCYFSRGKKSSSKQRG